MVLQNKLHFHTFINVMVIKMSDPLIKFGVYLSKPVLNYNKI